jgi:hypothetical protein
MAPRPAGSRTPAGRLGQQLGGPGCAGRPAVCAPADAVFAGPGPLVVPQAHRHPAGAGGGAGPAARPAIPHPAHPPGLRRRLRRQGPASPARAGDRHRADARRCRPVPAAAATHRATRAAPQQGRPAARADRHRRPDRHRLAARARIPLRPHRPGRAGRAALPMARGVRHPAGRPCCGAATPARPTATTWRWPPPTWTHPPPSWSHATPPDGASRSASKRPASSPASARPATAPAARSSAPSRSGWSASASPSSGTPCAASPPTTWQATAPAHPGTPPSRPCRSPTCWPPSGVRSSLPDIEQVSPSSPPRQKSWRSRQHGLQQGYERRKTSDTEEVTGSNPVAPTMPTLTSGNAGQLAVWGWFGGPCTGWEPRYSSRRGSKVDRPWVDQFDLG